MAFHDYLIGGGLAAAGLAFAEKGYSDIGDIGKQAVEEFSGFKDATGRRTGGLADVLSDRLQFQPYTVTTATGSDFGMMEKPGATLPDGTVAPGEMDYKLTLSPDEQAFYEARLAGSQGMFAAAETDTAVREQQVYDRMMAAMAPERDRERLALEERLAGQGRLGVRTSMFGGTSEQLAQAQAEEEARNQAILNSMTFAGQEQLRQSQLGAGMLSAGYIPQAQLLGAVTPGMTTAERQRQSVSEATGAYGETYAAGLEALLTSALGQAGIAGGFGTSMASAAIGGLFK
jgi:hypothetical protein